MAALTPFLQLYKPTTKELGWDDNMNANLDTIDGFVKQFMNIPGFVGTWLNSHLYAVGNVVLDTANASFYRCVTSHTSAATGTFAADRIAKPNGWALTTSPAQDSAAAAAASATAAANSAASATTQLTTFQNTYYGAFATAPLADPHGNARTTGDLYFDTAQNALNIWTGTVWLSVSAQFADAPTTPAGSVYVRTAAHTWALGVGQAGGDFTGDVHFGSRVSVSAAIRTTTNMPLGELLCDQFVARGAIGSNLYFSITPPLGLPAGGWRYVESTSAGTGAFAILSSTLTVAPNAGLHVSTFYSTPNGEASGVDAIATLKPMMQVDSNGNFAIFGGGFQPGGGLWNATSDARIKTIIGPYPHGLAELLEMLPKMFTYKGNDYSVAADGGIGEQIHPDTTKQYIGLVAQDCEGYMPELVTQTSAYIDGVRVDDVRQLDATGIIYALVNAVAELDARLKALEP